MAISLRRLTRKTKKKNPGDTGTELKRYVHSPLENTDEIRLLSIAPQSSSLDTTSIIIEHVRLSDEPLYTAISWTWGASTDTVEIRANGKQLVIQRQLSKILKYLQLKNQTRRLWVDAICIDQENLGERNHQVQLMGEIYSKANYVAACLVSNNRYALRREANSLRRSLERSPDSPIDISRFEQIFANQYFSRRWIIQEIYQARSVKFYCEGVEVPKSFLEDSSVAADASEGVSFPNRAVQLCRRRADPRSRASTLEELLYAHETAKCKETHDKVYALLSLTLQAKQWLAVQYEVSKEQLMLAVFDVCRVRESLPLRRTLSFLLFLQQHLEISDPELSAEIDRSVRDPAPIIQVQGTIRGVVKTLSTGAEVDAIALRLRQISPELTVYDSIPLGTYAAPHDQVGTANQNLHIRRHEGAGRLHAVSKVPDVDQYLFELHEERSTIAGLASSRLRTGDQVWQFDRTPVAVIVRLNGENYDIIGRAFLFPVPLLPEHHTFENELSWVKDSFSSNRKTPVISSGMVDLFELMKWVNFD